MSETSAKKHFNYVFKLKNGKKTSYRIELTTPDLSLVQKNTGPFPEWTKLAHHKCTNCPLNETEHTHCPVAKSLSTIIDFFRDTYSYETALVGVETDERSYYKDCEVQTGLSSLVGIYMVTSGCPVLDQLRPMVRHHLPFASPEETKYRALSMYMMIQYFRHKRGLPLDFDFAGLKKIYEEVRTVNMGFVKRLQDLKIKDASANALVTLDCFAWELSFSLDEELLKELETGFTKVVPYFLPEPPPAGEPGKSKANQ